MTLGKTESEAQKKPPVSRGLAEGFNGSWWARKESNFRPNGYEPYALTTELQAR